jgi:hypothetical protein
MRQKFGGHTKKGVTGQIFLQLQAMITHGHFDMPIGSNLHRWGASFAFR